MPYKKSQPKTTSNCSTLETEWVFWKTDTIHCVSIFPLNGHCQESREKVTGIFALTQYRCSYVNSVSSLKTGESLSSVVGKSEAGTTAHPFIASTRCIYLYVRHIRLHITTFCILETNATRLLGILQ